MAKKKGQHLVPACYLNSFVADASQLNNDNPRFQPGIYVNSNLLDAGWKMKGVNHDDFKRSYFYTLPEDEPDNPSIENFLCGVEQSYRKNLTKLQNEELDNQLISFISYFMTIQYIRVEKFIDNNQASWDQIGEWCDAFSGSNTYSSLFNNFVKKQIPIVDLGYIPHPHAHIIYNNTKFKFITSDNPVIKRNVNKIDLQLVIPKEYIADNAPESHESTFFFFPLTPSIAYVSCDLLACDKKLHFNDHQLVNIFYINYWSIVNSHKQIYSSVMEPIKGEEKLSFLLQQNKKTTYIKIYTANHRVMVKGKLQNSDNNSISFECENKQELLKLKNGVKVLLVEVIENNSSICGMIDCFVKNIDILSGFIEIESNFKINI